MCETCGTDLKIYDGHFPLTIYTTRGEGGNNVKCAVSLAAQGRLCGSDLVTHEFLFEEIAEAFRVLREHLDDPIHIVIIP